MFFGGHGVVIYGPSNRVISDNFALLSSCRKPLGANI